MVREWIVICSIFGKFFRFGDGPSISSQVNICKEEILARAPALSGRRFRLVLGSMNSSSAPGKGHGICMASVEAFRRADMTKHVLASLALAAAFTAGATLQLRSATAETAPAAPWQLGVVSGGGGPAAWRLNTATGFMELCSDAGGTPRCDAMPAPGTASSAPKGLLVPAPSGR